MNVGRTELALALDDMDENQDGTRFQRMALQLVRQTWPEIICSEPGKDLGVDARIPTSLAADGVGRAFACSITPAYAKILADARKIRANYPSLKVMIFATPEVVSNQRAEGWIQELQKELGSNWSSSHERTYSRGYWSLGAHRPANCFSALPHQGRRSLRTRSSTWPLRLART